LESAEHFKLAVKKYKNILIYIKGSPDPDAIASAFILKNIMSLLGVSSEIYTEKKISLQQNVEFAKLFKIPININKTPNIEKFDAYAVVDYQDAYIEALSKKIPCVCHLDHHEKLQENFPADFRIIDENSGSTSTIITELIESLDLKFEPGKMKIIASALLYGIQSDTDKYQYASLKDFQALDFLSKYSDPALVNKISGVPLSKEAVKNIHLADKNKIIYKDWAISGIGFIDDSVRDTIAIAADFLLKEGDYTAAIVFAAIEGERGLVIDASFRARSNKINLNDIIKEITIHGGGRKYKGAFQIDIDYFRFCPDKDLLWEVIYSTTLEVIKKRRDGIAVTDIKKAYRSFKNSLIDFFGRNSKE
jgi:nanoRNase/pAp phosphatase (c-di-AMP/oligoRNAs hydrolase)